ncbi:Transmembrane domain-containing protein [Spironucleus salmonicida]|uniref:Transmembrane domain-containing protein n=1 Tax=Spironucleus salmonicida TaxID=348837 RepID=V6LQP8_9EUKA|nr:Transmembrane domain-containing protein [Spironucleus salmonicida]|eukprot:EST46573.1 Transmembrane domain-containing protein [Spironucleus salmonicida]
MMKIEDEIDIDEPTINMVVSPLQKSSHFLSKSIVTENTKYTDYFQTSTNDLHNILISEETNTCMNTVSTNTRWLKIVQQTATFLTIFLQISANFTRFFTKQKYAEFVQNAVALLTLVTILVIQSQILNVNQKLSGYVKQATYDVGVVSFLALHVVLFGYGFSSKIEVIASGFCLASFLPLGVAVAAGVVIMKRE